MNQAIQETYTLSDVSTFVPPLDQPKLAIFTYNGWISQVVNISKKPSNYNKQIRKLQDIRDRFNG